MILPYLFVVCLLFFGCAPSYDTQLKKTLRHFSRENVDGCVYGDYPASKRGSRLRFLAAVGETTAAECVRPSTSY